mmetsp:Transcript_41724/g.54947  ORF Transcript_41724/g.54947 Transcript_41724/m.54947 type:complete len:86 (+) Transcript_41724:42-299(+)
MSAGPGHTGSFGGVGRCYKFWTGFTQCVSTHKDVTLCQLQKEDYFECLHRRKLRRRVAKVLQAREQAALAAENPDAAAAAAKPHH